MKTGISKYDQSCTLNSAHSHAELTTLSRDPSSVVRFLRDSVTSKHHQSNHPKSRISLFLTHTELSARDLQFRAPVFVDNASEYRFFQPVPLALVFSKNASASSLKRKSLKWVAVFLPRLIGRENGQFSWKKTRPVGRNCT